MILLLQIWFLVILLSGCSSVPKKVEFGSLPKLGVTSSGQEILLGGFSGLILEEERTDSGSLIFLTHTDRGPNAEESPEGRRPFALPDFQPQWIRFEYRPSSGQIQVIERVSLKGPDGRPLSGRPFSFFKNIGETPVDLTGNVLPFDPKGLDLEGITRTKDGTYWMADEYGPSLCQFDATGKMLHRYIPGKSDPRRIYGEQRLPAELGLRIPNRGFEGVTHLGGKIYGVMQSPLVPGSRWLRIVEFDPSVADTTAQYLYQIDDLDSDKIGDIVATEEGDFYVIERDSKTGPNAKKKIYRFRLDGATNVNRSGLIEKWDDGRLSSEKIRGVEKHLVLDMVAAGYTEFEKAEGLALLRDGRIAILNDNDFGVSGAVNFKSGTVSLDRSASRRPALVILGRE